MAEICHGFVHVGGRRPGPEAGVSGEGGGESLRTEGWRRQPQPQEQRHFLDSCFLCKRLLCGVGDLFMYRGDMAFCSEQCREEQMEIDEMEERSLSKTAMKMKASSRKEQQKAAAKSSARGLTVLAG